MRLEDCKVGQTVYVIKGTSNDWGQRIEHDEARTTTILFLGERPGANYTEVVVYRPTAIGGYGIRAGDPLVKYEEAWWVHPSQLELVKDINTKPLPKVIAYPNQCKICKSPSRKIGKIDLCSKSKCKSGINKNRYRKPYVKPLVIDAENYPICPECQCRAINMSNDMIRLSCINSHNWEHKWNDGQRFDNGLKYIYSAERMGFLMAG